jgi:hypothetical protein
MEAARILPESTQVCEEGSESWAPITDIVAPPAAELPTQGLLSRLQDFTQSRRSLVIAGSVLAAAVALALLYGWMHNRTHEVEGEVFIQTRGGSNVPLSLVDVSFIDWRQGLPLVTKLIKDAEGQTDVTIDYFFERLPKPVFMTRTDSQGHFRVTLPVGKRFLIAARSSRLVIGETEYYYWLVHYPPFGRPIQNNSKITLSNHNLVESGSIESALPPLKR